MSTLNNITTQIDSIKTDIVTSHTNLSSALTTKGVEVLPSDKMSNLIDKVENITLGKKWASGQVVTIAKDSSFQLSHNPYIGSSFFAEIPAIPFSPSYIIVYRNGGEDGVLHALYDKVNSVSSNSVVLSDGSGTGKFFVIDEKIDLASGGYKIPIARYGVSVGTCSWIAFE